MSNDTSNEGANPIYVVGHRNPDTDSIAAAVGYAALKQQTDPRKVIAARLGDPSPETAYLLERFGVPAPVLLHDVYTRVEDVMNRKPQSLPATATMREAGPVMRDKRLVPILDPEKHLLGVVTLDDVAARYLQETDLASGVQSRISYESMLRTLDGELLAGSLEGEWQGRVRVGASRAETLCRYIGDGDMVVLGDRTDAQLASLEAGAGCLILVGGAEADPQVLESAREHGARVISTPHDSYRVTRLLNLSIPLSEVMRRDVAVIEPDDLASDASELLSSRSASALPVVDGERKLVGIVSRSDLLRSRGKGVILVDHNHRSQAVEGLEQAQLLEVLDHHNLGDLRTPEPIYMKLEPVGSTSTIVAEMYRQVGKSPASPIAGMLAGGIVSDTLLFRSPTTTDRDREAGRWLAELAQIELEELAQGMFRANSNYENTTPERILNGNLKLFEWGGKGVGIGQAETVDISYFQAHREAFMAGLRELKKEKDLHYAFFLVTDILAEDSLMLLPGEEEQQLVVRAFGRTPQDGCVELPGVVSRKKQVVPALARELG